MNKELVNHRRRSVGLADLLYAPDRDERQPGLRLCSPASTDASRPAIRHLAHSFVKGLDGSDPESSATHGDAMLDQITAHVEDHPEDTRATLDALLRALQEASRESRERQAHCAA